MKDREAIVESVLKYNKIVAEAEKIAGEVAKVHGWSNQWGLEEVEIDTNEIHATFWASCCGETDHQYLSFPLSYLWDDDWVVKEEEVIRVREEAKQKKIEEDEQRRLAEQEARERAQLEKLKAKYEAKDG